MIGLQEAEHGADDDEAASLAFNCGSLTILQIIRHGKHGHAATVLAFLDWLRISSPATWHLRPV